MTRVGNLGLMPVAVWRRMFVAIALMLLLLLTSGCGIFEDESDAEKDSTAEQESTAESPAQSNTGLVTVIRAQRKAEVRFEGLMPDSDVAATTVDNGKKAKTTPVRRVIPRKGRFTVVLAEAAERPVIVRWVVASSGNGDQSPTERDKRLLLWVPIALVAGGVIAVFGGYLLAGLKSGAGAAFPVFARIAALIVISGVGLLAALMSTQESSEQFTALFTLLGLVAGYLAGTKTTPGTDETITEDGDGGGGNGVASPPGPPPGGPQATPRRVTRKVTGSTF